MRSLELSEYESPEQKQIEARQEMVELFFRINAAQELFTNKIDMPKVLKSLVWDYLVFNQEECNDAMLIGIASSLRQEHGVAGLAIFQRSVQDARRLPPPVHQPNVTEWTTEESKEAQQQVVKVSQGPGFFDGRFFRSISEGRQNLLAFNINDKHSTLADLTYKEFQAAFRAWEDDANDYAVPVVFALLMGVPGAFMLFLGLAGIGNTKGLIIGGTVLLSFAIATLFIVALFWSYDRTVRQQFKQGEAYIELYLALRDKIKGKEVRPIEEVDEDHLLTAPTITTLSLPVAASSRFLAETTTPTTPLLTYVSRSYASTDSEDSSSDEEQSSISGFRLS